MPEIARDFARKQVGRFSEFAAPPALDEGLTQTVNTLIEVSRSTTHCKKVVDAIIDSPGDPARWPSSERLRSVAWGLLTDEEKRVGCPKCIGTGFLHVTRLIGGIPYEASAPCSCRGPAPVEPEEKAPKRDKGLQKVAMPLDFSDKWSDE